MGISQDAINGGVAITACCSLFGLFMGTVRMSSLLFVACITRYNVDRQQASFPFVLAFAVRNIIEDMKGRLTKPESIVESVTNKLNQSIKKQVLSEAHTISELSLGIKNWSNIE